MAFDPTMQPVVDFDVIEGEIQVFGEEELSEDGMVSTEDGGVEIDFGEGSEPLESFGEVEDHDANLALYMEEKDLNLLATSLIQLYEADKRSRADWEKTYVDGLDLLGLKFEDRSEPWEGASGVYHPILGEAVVRFQSQTIGEILPAKGPVKTAIIGKYSYEMDKQARRVANYMNYTVMNTMGEYRRETDRLLWSLPLAGTAFRKVYWDVVLERPASKFVPAMDIVVNYAAESVETAERVTHVQRMSPNNLLKLQAVHFYRDDIVLSSANPERDAIDDAIDRLQGTQDTETDTDPRHMVLEIHTDLDLVGFEQDNGLPLPYIVSIDRTSSQILSIRRNWNPSDDRQEKEQHFAQYDFIPGFGFYSFGLIHLIGSLAKGATSALRQLIDAGTLANLPGGLKTRGLRTAGGDDPIRPGEWRDVDVPSGSIRDNLFPLPYGEPSATLFQLLEMIVRDGRSFASMADIKVSDMNAEAPVGTTLAIMERALKIQSAIQQRIHEALKAEFRILARVIRDYGEPAYPYETDEEEGIKKEDFDDRIDIIPVSDPNASTFSQRIMQFQAALQLVAQAPEVYDIPFLHRMVIEALGLPEADRIVPMEEEIPPQDPVVENMSILNTSPVKAHQHQDHDAHLMVHNLFLQDPQFQQDLQNSPMGQAVGSALDAHIREHMAFLYRSQIEEELGVELPPLGQPIPEDLEQRLSVLAAEAASQLIGKKQAMAQAEENAAMQQDPVVQQAERELDIREADLQRKAKADELDAEIKIRQIESKEGIVAAQIQQDERESQREAQADMDQHNKDKTLRAIKLGADIAKGSDSGGG